MVKTMVYTLMAGAMAAVFAMASPAEAMQHEASGHSMTMHHQHILLDHGLSMVLEGSNLVMLGKMEMMSSLDPMTVEHGKKMIANGKSLIEQTLSGPEMMEMHKAGKSPKDDPMMKATHDLGESVLKMVDLIEKMDAGKMGEHMMAMHHQHILVNHALDMALKGAGLAMLGGMEMVPAYDALSVEHGKQMIVNGKTLIGKVMGGDAMKEMHEKGTDPEKDPMMKSTHQMVEVAYKIIDQLERMLEGK